MATVWETVTGNSTLPIAPGTTFFDHLNNQQAGGGITRIVSGEALTLELLDRSIDIAGESNSIVVSDRLTAIDLDQEQGIEFFNNEPDLIL